MAVHGPAGDHQRHDRSARDQRRPDPLCRVERLRVGGTDQGQQTGESDRGHHRAPPGGRTGPAADEERRHGQREHYGERPQRLHQAQRTEREGDDVQQTAEAVERDRRPPAGPAQRSVLSGG